VRTLLIFIDGFGWGGTDPGVNPQHAYGGDLLRMPGPAEARTGPVAMPRGGWARPIDAVLGVPGLPQSATGQTTLLAGVNAQGALGKHLTGFPNEALRKILLEHSILRRITQQGWSARFLNAYRPRFFDFPREKQLHFSATTVANLAADLPFFTLDDIVAHRSIYQEFTNAELRERGFDVAPLSPAAAGGILGRAAGVHDFVLFEYFQTDKAGHTGELARGCAELEKLVLLVKDSRPSLSQQSILRFAYALPLTRPFADIEMIGRILKSHGLTVSSQPNDKEFWGRVQRILQSCEDLKHRAVKGRNKKKRSETFFSDHDPCHKRLELLRELFFNKNKNVFSIMLAIKRKFYMVKKTGLKNQNFNKIQGS